MSRIKGNENFQTVGPDVVKKQAEHVLGALLEPLQARLSLMAEKCEKSVLKRVAKVSYILIPMLIQILHVSEKTTLIGFQQQSVSYVRKVI